MDVSFHIRRAIVESIRQTFMYIAAFAFTGRALMNTASKLGLPHERGWLAALMLAIFIVMPVAFLLFEYYEKVPGIWYAFRLTSGPRYEKILMSMGCVGAFLIGALMELGHPVGLLVLFVIGLLFQSTFKVQLLKRLG